MNSDELEMDKGVHEMLYSTLGTRAFDLRVWRERDPLLSTLFYVRPSQHRAPRPSGFRLHLRHAYNPTGPAIPCCLHLTSQQQSSCIRCASVAQM